MNCKRCAGYNCPNRPWVKHVPDGSHCKEIISPSTPEGILRSRAIELIDKYLTARQIDPQWIEAGFGGEE